ncbi:MAG TPA: gas vesicle protein GvpG [Thermodesulfobacteriota bacterium]
MLIIDDLLLLPITGTLWVFKQIHGLAQEELANEAETITAELSEIYMMLETGQITEAEFDTREKELLDRLEELEPGEAEEEEAVSESEKAA